MSWVVVSEWLCHCGIITLRPRPHNQECAALPGPAAFRHNYHSFQVQTQSDETYLGLLCSSQRLFNVDLSDREGHTNSRLLSDSSKLFLITENRKILTWIDKIFQFKLR